MMRYSLLAAVGLAFAVSVAQAASVGRTEVPLRESDSGR